MKHKRFKIVGETDPENGVLYWSNELGWVDIHSATMFHVSELYDINFPVCCTGIAWIQDNGLVLITDTLAQAFARTEKCIENA